MLVTEVKKKMQIPLPDMSQAEDQFPVTEVATPEMAFLNNGVTTSSALNDLTPIVPTAFSSDSIQSIDPSSSRIASLNIPIKKTISPKVTYNGASSNDKRVKISMLSGSPAIFYRDPNNKLLTILNKTNGVIFPFQPAVAISYSSNYENQVVTHSNFMYHSYKNSEIKAIDITCDFVVRTPFEGQYVTAALHFLRCLTMMFTGNDSSVGSGKINLAGAPPLVVSLSGMGFIGLDSLPVAVTNVTTTFPDNVDYVTVSLPGLNDEITKIPTQMTVSISVIPMFSRLYVSHFGLQDFSNGTTRLMGPNPDLSSNLDSTSAELSSVSLSAFSTNTPVVMLGSDNTAVSTTSYSGALPTIQTQTDTSLDNIQL